MNNTKIQIKSVFGKVLFEYECENNSVKKTIIKAAERGADLRRVNLRGADLWGADLWGVNLRGADLWGANLQEADLREADLREADLREADLRRADLRAARLWRVNLRGADLWGANLQEADLQEADLQGADLPIFCKWNVSVQEDKIKIGCHTKTIKEWDAFFKSTEEYETKRGTEDFIRIEANYKAVKAYLKHLNKNK